jgi:hypothetical protein
MPPLLRAPLDPLDRALARLLPDPALDRLLARALPVLRLVPEPIRLVERALPPVLRLLTDERALPPVLLTAPELTRLLTPLPRTAPVLRARALPLLLRASLPPVERVPMRPALPLEERPAVPEVDRPAVPEDERPAAPEVERPAVPDEERPVEPILPASRPAVDRARVAAERSGSDRVCGGAVLMMRVFWGEEVRPCASLRVGGSTADPIERRSTGFDRLCGFEDLAVSARASEAEDEPWIGRRPMPWPSVERARSWIHREARP